MMQNETTEGAQALADTAAAAVEPAIIKLIGEGTMQMPPQASTLAADVDALYYFIFWGCTAFFVLIVGLCALFIVKYRRKEGQQLEARAYHNTPLEVTWTVIPFLLLLVVFVWGFKGFMHMNVAPGNSLDYYVTAKKWMWEIKDPNGQVTLNEMVVPVNQPVKIILRADDILHSFFIPAFRVKADAIPNRYNNLWFEATREGVYDIFCTEYCGSGHSGMLGKVTVVSQEAYDAGFGGDGRLPDEPLVVYGERLYASKACITCHSLDGSKKTGPTWQGLFGKQEELTDGSSVTVDESYIRESIIDPGSRITAGFDNVMPTYAGTLDDEAIEALIEFIKAQQ